MQSAKQQSLGNPPSIYSALRRLFVAALVLFATISLSIATADEGGPAEWQLADGTTVNGTVMAVRGSMVQLQTANGLSLISISRFSDEAREEIRKQFPEKANAPSPSRAPSQATPPPPAVAARPHTPPPTKPAAPSGEAQSVAESLPPHPGLRTLKVGDAAPELRVKKFGTDETLTLESLRGRVVLLVFWNSTEPHAVRDIQYLAVAHEAIPPEVVSIVGVSVDRQFRRYNAVATQLGATWPSHHDPARAVMRHWGVTAVPTTVVIDQNGRIFKEHIFATQLPEVLQEMNLLPNR